jgi:ligand-binding SRPBCC domain-containing protein
MKIIIKTRIQQNYLEIKKRFDHKLFLKLSPPFPKVKLVRFDGCEVNHEVHIILNANTPVAQNWVSKITQSITNDTEFSFIDVGMTLPAPLKKWTHHHKVLKVDDNFSVVVDDIEYFTYHSFLDAIIFPALYLTFYYRKKIYQRELV